MQNVTVYGAPWCSYCVALENKLKSMNVEYDYRDVDEPGVREEMNAKTDNNQTIPVLFIGKQYWVNPSVALLKKQFAKFKHIEKG